MPGWPETIRKELAEWREAFSGLSDNPAARFAGVVDAAGMSREPVSPQLLRGCGIALAAALLLSALHFLPGLLEGGPAAGGEELHLEAILGLLLFIAVPIAPFWYAGALFGSARLCLGALARVQGGRRAYSLDESLFFTPLTEREIIAALLAGCAARLTYPLLLGSFCLSCAVGMALLSSRLYSFGNPSFDERSVLWALPVFFVSYFAVSALGTLAMLLCCIVLGRAIGSLAALNAAAFTLCCGQFLWLLWSMQLGFEMAATPRYQSMQGSLPTSFSSPDTFLLALLCSTLLALALLGLLRLALQDAQLGLVIHFCLPLAGLLVVVLPIGLGIFATLQTGQQSDILMRLGYAMSYAVAQFNGLSLTASPFYPLATPDGSQRGLLTTPLFEWWRPPLLLVLQLGLLPVLLRVALEACRLRRQE